MLRPLGQTSRQVTIVLCLVAGWGCGQGPIPAGETLTGAQNQAYRWAEISLEATARDTDRYRPRPTVTSRCLALTWTAVFDAWSRFDDTAETVYMAGEARVAPALRTPEAKAAAISYAAYTALCHYYAADSLWLRDRLTALGYPPDPEQADPEYAARIGVAAARSVIAARHHDGANQYGDAEGADPVPYADYTSYVPVNHPDSNLNLSRWQPKYFLDDQGERYAPGCLTPHWTRVKPIALTSAGMFRPGPPPLSGSSELAIQVQEVVDLQAGLTPEQKALVEFMRDGPSSVQQAGHWLRFAMDVSARDGHSVDQDVELFFLTTVAAMDAFIACWDAKVYYDFARPMALVRDQFRGLEIRGWAGPAAGMQPMKGEDWRPYSPDSFLCPPFPAYVSGHSTVSAACAEVLRLCTGRDTFGLEVRWLPGSLTEPGLTPDSVTLSFPTFSATADLAGISRVLGGYHIQADNTEGLALGRKVGVAVWTWYRQQHQSRKGQ